MAVVSSDVRRIDPPRPVEIWHDGAWVPGVQTGWVRQPDGSWKADVQYVVRYDWGPGKHVRTVTEGRVRLREGEA